MPKSIEQAQLTIERAASDLREQVRGTREKIEHKKSEREWLASGYLPRDEQRARIAELVDARGAHVGEEARMWLGECLRYGGAPGYTSLFTYRLGNAGEMSTLDLSGLLCFLFPDALKQRLGDVIDELDFDEGPPSAERPAMIRQLDADILALERAEEGLIVEAEAAGIYIARHPDADPRAVLEVEEDMS